MSTKSATINHFFNGRHGGAVMLERRIYDCGLLQTVLPAAVCVDLVAHGNAIAYLDGYREAHAHYVREVTAVGTELLITCPLDEDTELIIRLSPPWLPEHELVSMSLRRMGRRPRSTVLSELARVVQQAPSSAPVHRSRPYLVGLLLEADSRLLALAPVGALALPERRGSEAIGAFALPGHQDILSLYLSTTRESIAHNAAPERIALRLQRKASGVWRFSPFQRTPASSGRRAAAAALAAALHGTDWVRRPLSAAAP